MNKFQQIPSKLSEVYLVEKKKNKERETDFVSEFVSGKISQSVRPAHFSFAP